MKNFNLLPDFLKIMTSIIHGVGLFALVDIEKNVNLGVSHFECPIRDLFPNDIIRTVIGGAINHSYEPNCTLIKGYGYWTLQTIKDIEDYEELTLDYTKFPCGVGQDFLKTICNGEKKVCEEKKKTEKKKEGEQLSLFSK